MVYICNNKLLLTEFPSEESINCGYTSGTWYSPYISFSRWTTSPRSTTISKMQSMGMKKIKRWLGLTRSTTVAVIHHPDMLGVPFLPQLQTKAKLTYLSSVFPSDDPMIQELTILDKPTAGRLGIPSEALSVFNQARASIASISRKTLFNECHAIAGAVKTHWESRLTSLSVQGKFRHV